MRRIREIRQEVCFDHREGKTSTLKKVRGMTDNYVRDSYSDRREKMTELDES